MTPRFLSIGAPRVRAGVPGATPLTGRATCHAAGGMTKLGLAILAGREWLLERHGHRTPAELRASLTRLAA